jgi:hypothetical protein
MLQIFGVLSGLLPIVGVIPYDRDILRHKTRPHRSSFLIWSILGGIAFSTQLAKGASWSLFLPASDTIATFSIFVLSIWYGSGGFSKKDMAGLLMAAMGLILWYFTKEPFIALLITIGVDALGTVLTLVKTWAEPESETFSSWLLAALGGLFAAFAAGKGSAALLAYPVYIFVANAAVGIVILLRRKT